jgi:carbamoyltransferase
LWRERPDRFDLTSIFDDWAEEAKDFRPDLKVVGRMIILGICDMINSGAALMKDGEIAAAVSEERLNRMKLTVGYPRGAIAAVLAEAGVAGEEVDAVAIAQRTGYFYPACKPCPGWLEMRSGGMRGSLMKLGSTLSPLVGKLEISKDVYRFAKGVAGRKRPGQFRALLERDFGIRKPATFYDHHYVHACTAYYTSDFDDCLVVTLDGGGDGCSSHVYSARGGRMELLDRTSSFDSIGNYYSYVTNLCGFKTHRHEGKITGLAGFGRPAYVDILSRFIRYEDGRIRNVGGVAFDAAVAKLRQALPEGFDRADLASSIQVLLEDVVGAYVGDWLERTGHTRIAVAGGVFSNVKLNQRLAELDGVEKVFVHPAMDDGGLPLGAALARRHEEQPFTRGGRRLANVYFGPGFPGDAIEASARRSGLPYRRCGNVADEIAALLAAGKVVCRFHGRMEHGPRALGNRSILYQTTDPSVNTWMNEHLRRTEFMPFAPATLKSHAAERYAGYAKADDAARFMTITFDCTEVMKRESPGVVHVDGTARPQVVDEATSPDFHAILTAYHRRTGIPSLINTSFNIHEEPIVCTPDDALRALADSSLEYLAIGDLIVDNRAAVREERAAAVAQPAAE